MKHRLRALMAITAVASAVACASGCATETSVTQVWRAQVEPTALKSMLVLSAATDEPTRRVLEDALVADLRRRGVSATPSYEVFKGNLPPVDEARSMVNEQHYEGVLVARLQGVKEQQHYVPPSSGFWTGYYAYGWGGAPGYVVTDEIVVFEVTLWDVRSTDRLLWTARTNTTNPRSGGDFAKSLTKAVTPALARSHFIPSKAED